jgi:hypothetical protein
MDELSAALAQFQRAEASMDRAKVRLHAAMADAVRSGMPIRHVARVTGYSPSQAYVIMADHGIVAPTRPSMAGNRHAA